MNAPLTEASSAALSVRELQAPDIPLITQYWLSAGAETLRAMGADIAKLPSREEWHKLLSAQLSQPYSEKQAYAIIWLVDDKPVGHCNVNKIIFGKEAYMHLHLWEEGRRHRGLGTELVKMSLPYFFRSLRLKTLYCEPYAENPAPNKTLAKLGFRFVKEYITVPGYINFEQLVKRWELDSPLNELPG
jgi:RimJ/RimL family protein N-acetyltransferase